MCPACMASAVMVAGSVISTGGIAAFAATVVRKIKRQRSPKIEHKKEK